jgi:hypothetical protein
MWSNEMPRTISLRYKNTLVLWRECYVTHRYDNILNLLSKEIQNRLNVQIISMLLRLLLSLRLLLLYALQALFETVAIVYSIYIRLRYYCLEILFIPFSRRRLLHKSHDIVEVKLL